MGRTLAEAALRTDTQPRMNGAGRSGKVQLLVPIYNEGENVRILYDRLVEEQIPFDSLTFVHDLETDTSLPYIQEMQRRDPRVRAELNRFGRGVVHALRWGFSRCEPGPLIVLMGDNSDKLSIIPEMVQLWQGGATLVSPSRYIEGGAQHGGPPLKSFLSKTAGRFLGWCGFPTADATNNFKLYDGQWIRRQQVESEGGFEVALELCYKAFRQGERISELPTEWWDRTMGESRFKLWKWIPKYLNWYLKALAAVLQSRLGLLRPARQNY